MLLPSVDASVSEFFKSKHIKKVTPFSKLSNLLFILVFKMKFEIYVCVI